MTLNRIRSFPIRSLISLSLCLLLNCTTTFALETRIAQKTGQLQFNVQDVEGKALPCRIHLRDESGAPMRALDQPFWHDHFVCSGSAMATVAPGRYFWTIERGPEYAQETGTIDVHSGAKHDINVTMERLANVRDRGWYSADLHVHRAVEEIPLHLLAEDLNFAPVIGWWNTPAPEPPIVSQTEFTVDKDHLYTVQAGEDEREGGALLYFGLKRQLDLTVKSREVPSPMFYVRQAVDQRNDVWIDIEKPFWWDTPTWLAVANPSSIGIAHNHMHRGGVLDNEAWGKARDRDRFGDLHGNGLWTQEIYYHALNSGLRIPPSAGSASGVLPNPVGYNRVYVELGDQPLTRDNWFDALKNGRCFVTNGPLLLAKVEGTGPGNSLKIKEEAQLEIEAELICRDPIRAVEIVVNGQVIQRLGPYSNDHEKINITIPASRPGWMLVRAIVDDSNTFRFASTAPWYLETDSEETFISQASAQFFLDWVNERIERINATVPDIAERGDVLQWHLAAREFWLAKREVANAE